MNVTDYTYLINKPDAINEKYTEALGNVLDEFPFFQSARALRLKGLYNQSSFKYNFALKVNCGVKVASFGFRVSSFRFQVLSFKFQVSGFRFQVFWNTDFENFRNL